MSPREKGAILAAAAALLACVAFAVESRLALIEARKELRTVTAANEFLKKTLGDMTLAITAKDKQIDRLENGSCEGAPVKPPAAAPSGPSRKAPAKGQVSRVNIHPAASEDTGAK